MTRRTPEERSAAVVLEPKIKKRESFHAKADKPTDTGRGGGGEEAEVLSHFFSNLSSNYNVHDNSYSHVVGKSYKCEWKRTLQVYKGGNPVPKKYVAGLIKIIQIPCVTCLHSLSSVSRHTLLIRRSQGELSLEEHQIFSYQVTDLVQRSHSTLLISLHFISLLRELVSSTRSPARSGGSLYLSVWVRAVIAEHQVGSSAVE